MQQISSLSGACKTGSLIFVEYAISGGGKPDAETLNYAIKTKNSDIIEAVIRAGALAFQNSLTIASQTGNKQIVERVIAVGGKPDENTLLVAAKVGIYAIFKLVCNIEPIINALNSKELCDMSKLASYAREEFKESDSAELSEIFDALVYWFPEQALKMKKSRIYPTVNSLTRICSSPILKQPDIEPAYWTEGLQFKEAVYSNPSRCLTDVRAKLIELTIQRAGLAGQDTFNCYLSSCRYKKTIRGGYKVPTKITSHLHVQSKEILLLHQAGVSVDEILNGLEEDNQLERLIDDSKSFRKSSLASSFPESLQQRIQEATQKQWECVIA